jgi:EAL domain-containing protein (putative c-di-GMP-specific phosphodiesterase class I)
MPITGMRMKVPVRSHIRRAIIVAGVPVLAGYWIALALGARDPLVTRWLFLAQLIVPTTLVLARAAAVREGRSAWAAIGAGLAAWTAGCIWDAVVPAPSLYTPAVPLWLASFPLLLGGFYGFARPWLRRAPATLLLETLLVVFGSAAVVSTVVLPGVNPQRALGLAFPLIDGLLVSTALIGAAVAGRRPGSPWALIALGSLVLVAGDAMWSLGADGAVLSSNAIYPLWPGLVAAAAYLPQRDRLRAVSAERGMQTNATTFVAAGASVALLVLNEWLPIPATSVVLAALAMVTALHRSGMALAAGLRGTRTAARDRELVDEVRDALEREELELHFQPLVDAAEGTVKGAEALLRWYRDGRFIAPDTFLGAVERSALIRPLTDFVLDRALAAAARWRAKGHELSVSVNLATTNLTEADLPGRVLHALRRHGVPAAALTLEITETATIEDNVLAGHVLQALDQLGVGLAIDDFGTGHSSLVRLANFPVCELKIDRSFVQVMHSAKQPIVATAVQLAHALGLRVVGEGVEDQATLDALCALECDLVQGYFVSRPLPGDAFEAWLRAQAYSRA